MQLRHNNQNKTNRKPPDGIISRFMISAFFGGFMSFIVFFLIYELMLYVYDDNILSKYIMQILFHALWIVPLLWGILGIFLFDKMLTIASKIFESFLDALSWPNR